MSDELSAEAEARVGRVLNDKYTLERLLGVGGMAAVYLGRHRNGARVAVKILHTALARNPAVRERFLREAYAANKVEHYGVAQVLDDDEVRGGDDDGAAYLVMELLEGESLEDRAAHPPPIDEQELLRVLDGVLDVLESAHPRGVVHRDLKPDNIFLMRDPEDGRIRVKVLDFGLARLAEAAGSTQFGLALGTPSYMSPEQAAGKVDEIDGRTDLFALGATGFRLLTSRRIHDADNIVVLVAKMASEPAPPIRSIAPDVSPGIAAIIDKALAFDREARYQTAADMRADVRALRDASVGPLPAAGIASARTVPAAPAAIVRAAPAKPAAAPEPTMHLSGSDLEAEPSSEAVAPEPAPKEAKPPASKKESKEPREPREAKAPTEDSEPPPPPRRRTGLWLFTILVIAGLFMAYRVRTEEDPFGFLRDLGLPIASSVLPTDAAPAVAPPADAESDAAQVLVDAETVATSLPVDTSDASSDDDAGADASTVDDASLRGDFDASSFVDAATSPASTTSASSPPVPPPTTRPPSTAPPPPPPPKHTAHPPPPPPPPKKPPHPPHKKH